MTWNTPMTWISASRNKDVGGGGGSSSSSSSSNSNNNNTHNNNNNNNNNSSSSSSSSNNNNNHIKNTGALERLEFHPSNSLPPVPARRVWEHTPFGGVSLIPSAGVNHPWGETLNGETPLGCNALE